MSTPIEEDYMVTTYDNPINPFDEFELWWKTDLLLGHDCCSALAKFACLSSVDSEKFNEIDVKFAIDELIKQNPTLYKKVSRKDYQNSNKIEAPVNYN